MRRRGVRLAGVAAGLVCGWLALGGARAETVLVTYEGRWGTVLAGAAAGTQVPGGVVTRRYDGRLDHPALAGADLVDADSGAADRLCDEGPAHPLARALAAPVPGGAAVPGAGHACGTGYLVTALVLGTHASGPGDWAGFLDARAHPGARALPRGARGTLELALMGLGVPAGDVYGLLSTEAGLARAYAALDRLAADADLMFWRDPAEAVGWLETEAVAAAAVPSAHLATAMRDAGDAGLRAHFDGQIYRIQRLVLLAGPPARQRDAAAVMRHLLTPATQAALARALHAGPVARAAFGLLTPAEAAWMPTAPQHDIARRGLGASDDFWAGAGAAIAARHADWLARVEAASKPR